MVKKMAPHRRSEAGYNLVILMMMLTVLNIFMAAALPKWSHVIRREREEELISRGFQYAEAIRIFQNRFQRLPVRIEELVEVEPRSIRKLWKDPMTDEGNWVLIPPGTGGPALTPQPEGPDGRNGQEGPDGSDSGEPSEEVPDNTGIGQKKGTTQVGPFIGVHSRSSKESILIFNGHNRYDQWHFTVEMLTQGGSGGNRMPPEGAAGNPAQGMGLQLSTKWLGRPLPRFLQPEGTMDGELPNPRNQPNPRGANRGGGPARR
jgi:type II secretory pathway pseudopilin PulG